MMEIKPKSNNFMTNMNHSSKLVLISKFYVISLDEIIFE